jgi:hypothetical protein
MFNIPFLEYATCLSIGAVIFGITNSIEYGLLGLLIANLILPMFRVVKKEGFANKATTDASASKDADADADSSSEDADAEDEDADAESVKGEKGRVSGALSSSVSQASSVTSSTTPSSFTGTSTPASASASESPSPASKKGKISEKDIPPANQPADLIKEDKPDEPFEDSSGLFKLGKIPADEKGGFHIDAGSSVLNALKSLKPDQISAMTQDTKQLIETQKTLMNMLQSFKPMMSEGKEMMDTFQQMFSSNGGSAMNALKTAQDTLKG